MPKHSWKIGDIVIDNQVVIAPMAGISNPAFRVICKQFGAGLIYTEMVSDKALYYDNEKTVGMTAVEENEHPLALQLFGHDIETMVYVSQNSKLQIGGVLFSGILIASLGAVMDVAVSISSTIEEIHNKRPELTAKELFKSGIHVGKDMMGTMSNTLILAFTGGAINTMILIYAYIMPYLQVVNMYSIGIEVIKGISGTLGIVLTVPIVSVISAKVYSGDSGMCK